ncbi:MAG: OadG family protein [Gammaproteobacteria bacterium]|nr:OadG family protein [Gammaproteobacteria bacterium]
MIAEGLNLAMFGMGTVFVFLVVLIFVTKLMSVMVRALDVNSVRTMAALPVRPRADQLPVTGNAGEDARLRAILSAAVQQYKSKN